MTTTILSHDDFDELDDLLCALIETTKDVAVLEQITIIGSPHHLARGAVAANPNCPAELLRKLYENADGDELTLMNVAENPATPPDILAVLTGKPADTLH